MVSQLIEAPWSVDQVTALNDFQEAQFHHPYTCPICPADLVATSEGWVCPREHYKQRWAHATHGDIAWVENMKTMYGRLRSGRFVDDDEDPGGPVGASI